MRFHYCPDCGSALELRPIGDEGDTPWCPQCQRPLFDQFSTCVIALVVNGRNEAAVLRQGYISRKYGNLVSGYMKPGETAEDCVRREIEEELGLHTARTEDSEIRLSEEVDSACWLPVEEALGQVHPEGSISYALIRAYLDRGIKAADDRPAL